MKKLIFVFALLFVSTNVFSQSSKYSLGLIGSHFHNSSSGDRISLADDPYGYGIVVSNTITDDLSLAVTGEYLKDNFLNNTAEEKDLRFGLSAIIHPFRTNFIQPYFSGGFVYTHRAIEYNDGGKADKNDNIINGRLGIGANIPIISNLFLNGDLGMYTDGFGYVGWGSSLGFRMGL